MIMSDSIDNQLDYQEQVLDDLDEIKGSLDAESEYYDKEYQKEVLQSLKSIEKSVKSDNVDYEIVDITSDYFKTVSGVPYLANDEGATLFSSGGSSWVYDISSYDILEIHYRNSNNYYMRSGCISDLSDPPAFGSYNSDYKFLFYQNTYGNWTNTYDCSDYDYLYIGYGSNTPSEFYVKGYISPSSGGDDPLPDEPVEVVTTSSAVIIEGLENLTQITTFQSFCSSLLIGILLFLVFVKGLRK